MVTPDGALGNGAYDRKGRAFVGGKTSKVRKHGGSRSSTPYARPSTGRHAGAVPSNAAALRGVELARPLENGGWWGRLSSLASSLVTGPLGFFKTDQGGAVTNEEPEANGDLESVPGSAERKTTQLSALIEESVDGVELSEEEYFRITQLLKSKTKPRKPSDSIQRPPVGDTREETPQQPDDTVRKQLQWRPALQEAEQNRREKRRGEENAWGNDGTVQEDGLNNDEESPLQAALTFMNQARVPARSADRSPESEKSFSFPSLGGAARDQYRGGDMQAEDWGAQFRTPAARRSSVAGRPYTLQQQRAGSVEVADGPSTRWTPMRVPLSGGREVLKRRASQVDNTWQTESLRRIRQRGLDEATVQRRSFRQAVQAPPTSSLRPPSSLAPAHSAKAPQSAQRTPSLPLASQRGVNALSTERALSVEPEQGRRRRVLTSSRTEMSKTASKIFETLDMMLSPQKLVGSNLSPEVLRDMSLNERARLSASTLDALPPVEPLRASPGRESPPSFSARDAFPPSTSAEHQAALTSTERILGNGAGETSIKAIEGRQDEQEKQVERKDSGQKEAPIDRGPTTEETGRERGGKRSRTFKMSAAGLDDDEGGPSIFLPSQPATQSALAPSAVTTSMAGITSNAALFKSSTGPAFTFAPSEKQPLDSKFEALSQGTEVKASSRALDFSINAQTDTSFSSLVGKAEDKAAPPTLVIPTTSAPIFSGFTAKPLESAPATPSFNFSSGAASVPPKAFSFAGVTPAGPAFTGFSAASTTAVVSGKRKAEDGVEKAEEHAPEGGLMAFLSSRKRATVEGDASKPEIQVPAPTTKEPASALAVPQFGASLTTFPVPSFQTFGNTAQPSAKAEETTKPEGNAETAPKSNGDGTERSAKRSQPSLQEQAPAKPNLFTFSLPASTSAIASSASVAPFVFGQQAASEPAKSFAPFGTATSAAAASLFAFGATKPSETPPVVTFGVSKAAEVSPTFGASNGSSAFGVSKPSEPASASASAPSSFGSAFAFGVQSNSSTTSSFAPSAAAFSATPATSPSFFSTQATTSAASAPFSFSATGTPSGVPFAFGAQPTSAPTTPAFGGFGGGVNAPLFGATNANEAAQTGPPSPGSAMDDSGMAEEPMQPTMPTQPALAFGQQAQQAAAPQSGVFGFNVQPNPFPAPQNPFQPSAAPFGSAPQPAFGTPQAQPFAGFGAGQGGAFSLGSTGAEPKSGRVIRKAKRPVKK